MVGWILGLGGRKLRLWGRSGEGGYVRLIRSTGVAPNLHPIQQNQNYIDRGLVDGNLVWMQKNMFQNQAYCLQSIPSHRNKSPCHIFTTGGGGEHNEGERTLAYYPKIDDKYCFLDAMASLESMLESERVMFLRFCQILGISSGCVQFSMENIAKGTTDSSIEWFY